MQPLIKKILTVCSLSALAITTSGCSFNPLDIEPWVKPYERQNMADPVMNANRDPVSSTYMHHVYQAREGARGAEGGGGGGCGCN